MRNVRRIVPRQWSIIQEIAQAEGRDLKNVLDLVIDKGLSARSLGEWPTPVGKNAGNHHEAA